MERDSGKAQKGKTPEAKRLRRTRFSKDNLPVRCWIMYFEYEPGKIGFTQGPFSDAKDGFKERGAYEGEMLGFKNGRDFRVFGVWDGKRWRILKGQRVIKLK